MYYKCKLNVVHFINQTVWVLQDRSLERYLFNARETVLLKKKMLNYLYWYTLLQVLILKLLKVYQSLQNGFLATKISI